MAKCKFLSFLKLDEREMFSEIFGETNMKLQINNLTFAECNVNGIMEWNGNVKC
jgi:hypothetical protein